MSRQLRRPGYHGLLRVERRLWKHYIRPALESDRDRKEESSG